MLITGASSGFGEEFARQYAAQGKSLVLVARRLDRLEALSAQLRERFHIDVLVEQVDLSSIPAIIDLHARLSERNILIDVLINNAGHGLQGPFLTQSLDQSLAMIAVDIASVTALTHLFATDMRIRQRGHILMVASLLSFQGVKNFAVYSAAKAYVLRFSEALHRELKNEGIAVTALCPGMSDTGFAESAMTKAHTGFENGDDATPACCARRNPGAASRTHECRSGVWQQGNHRPDLGHATLVSSRPHGTHHGRLSKAAFTLGNGILKVGGQCTRAPDL